MFKDEKISDINYKFPVLIPINIINEKLYKNELTIEELLRNDECISDLENNSKSKYIKIMTIENIKKLIKYCLIPNEIKAENSEIKLRYSYYSCQLLCSRNGLLFSNSIKDIKKSCI